MFLNNILHIRKFSALNYAILCPYLNLLGPPHLETSDHRLRHSSWWVSSPWIWIPTEKQGRGCMDKMTPWQNCLDKCHIGKMASLFNVTLTQILWQMSPKQIVTWTNVTFRCRWSSVPCHANFFTWTNVTWTNVTKTNCHLDKMLPLDAMIKCPLSCQFFHLDKCHQDKCHETATKTTWSNFA